MIIKRKVSRFIQLALLATGCCSLLSLSGCAHLGQAGIVNTQIVQKDQQAQVSIAEVGDDHNTHFAVQDLDRAFLNGVQIAYRAKQPTLPDFLLNKDFILSVQGAFTLDEVIAQISRASNHRIQNQVEDQVSKITMDHIDFEGSLSDFLSMVAARFNIYWHYDKTSDIIVFRKYETHQFMVESALPTTTSISSSSSGSTVSSVNGGGSSVTGAGNTGAVLSGGNSAASTLTGSGGGSSGGGSSGGGGTSSSVNASSNFDFWSGINSMLKGLIGNDGSSVSDQNTGMIEVTTTPDRMKQVTEYIQAINHQLHQMVSVDVRVLVVNDSINDNYGVQWQLLTKTTGSSYSMSGTPPVNASGANMSYTVLNPKTKWANTNLIVNAMTQNVRVVENKHYPIVVSNDQPAPISETTNYTYISSAGAVAVPNSGVQSSVTPGSITVGLNMTLVPRIQANGRIILSVSANLSSLLGMTTVSSGSQSVQEPEVSNQSFMEEIELKNDSTAVLVGFESKVGNLTAQGAGSPWNWLIGGGDQATNTVSRLVFIITPHIMHSF